MNRATYVDGIQIAGDERQKTPIRSRPPDYKDDAGLWHDGKTGELLNGFWDAEDSAGRYVNGEKIVTTDYQGMDPLEYWEKAEFEDLKNAYMESLKGLARLKKCCSHYLNDNYANDVHVYSFAIQNLFKKIKKTYGY